MKLLDCETIQPAMLRSADDLREESGYPVLALDIDSLAALDEEWVNKLRQWSRQQPCAVIGVGSSDSPVAHCVDSIVDGSEFKAMLRRIAANPQATLVLVQVLRAIEDLAPEDALMVESLGYAALQSGDEFKRWLTHYQARLLTPPVPESGPPVLVTRSQAQLSVVLNRPLNNNAFSVEMRDALVEAFELVNLDDSLHQVSVFANGRCFCTGGELTEFGKVASPIAGHLIRSQRSPAKFIMSSPERYHFHVHKACVGSGVELPACAGYFTASEKTLFWLPELSMGLIPGAGGCISISRRIGRQRTAYLVIMNKKINAQTALQWGLIDAITDEIDK
ncbi:enoyl-CoA hydratase/isomerase family protein [Ketobacter sp. MCCC 1A13808]|uniref:enoyl-CoA hydratase/isomerase family protein n=1 Tax=Ketobacter sp. MCCC 1A13808 TaxID=2602738 RepID=UPI000F10A6FB|nr:enoyl-CoA hydratase/isomerase family protein [Ketobacter sp. MCCC 1A13808]MVF13428.1 enoyl-CoA hydratase/isomerase family protein [Ketobacter sp. MCCC 1A13808]RLP52947.1 MAG: enoyl-CoA hydratase/isomerase family protein [Ketobacter sp.]